MTPQLVSYYRKKFPGIRIIAADALIMGRTGTMLSLGDKSMVTQNQTSVDNTVLDFFDADPPAMAAPYERHTSAPEIYDEFKTADRNRITVMYDRHGKFVDMEIRLFHPKNGSLYEDHIFTKMSEVRAILSALHGAVASINRKEMQDGSEK